MKPETILKHEFVEFIPGELKLGTIYISIRFGTASHLCCCGCGNKVVTPLRPTDWKLIFDGKTISLDPSIGNWSFTCQSHYWIRNNRVQWAESWSKERIVAGRDHDASVKRGPRGPTNVPASRATQSTTEAPQRGKPKEGIWQKLRNLFRRK